MVIISKTGQLATRKCNHIEATPITAEQYLRDQINKNTKD